jgi:hypothetical protein
MSTSYLRAFPSSISNDGGRVFTEKNIKSILDFIASSRAVVSGFRLTPTQLESVVDGLEAAISSGKAIFDGYQLEFTYDQYNIPFPDNITTGEYYICLRMKFSTGANAFIEYKNFVDLPTAFDVDCPFVVIESDTELIPDDDTVEAGYNYCYLPLYKLIYIDGILGAQGPIDVRNRTFINADKIALGYKDDITTDYFGFDGTDGTEGYQDWKVKNILSRHGQDVSIEQLLLNYIEFIHTVVRGYTSLTNVIPEDPLSMSWDTEALDTVGGEAPLPILNQASPEDSIVRRLKYTINGSRDYINGRIVLPSTYNPDGTVTYTPSTYSLGYILTLDNEKLLNRIFLPKASTSNTGIVQIIESFTADDDNTYQDTKVLSIDSSANLKNRGPRYSISHIKYKPLIGEAVSTINIVSNDSNFELDADQNIQITPITTDKYNPILKIAVYGTVGLAYGLQYDSGVNPTTFPGNSGKTYYVINQNLRTTDNVTFNQITITNQIITSAINPSNDQLDINANTSINGDVVVDGTLIADLVRNAGHNDVAELFLKNDLDFTYEPGDLIAKIPGKNTYGLSTQQNNKLVVGVVSSSPGYLLGGEGEEGEDISSYLKIGLIGRVPVKIIGPIMEGDLITTSYIDGVGIKASSYEPGTIVGKALETKNSVGLDKINMLIALM